MDKLIDYMHRRRKKSMSQINFKLNYDMAFAEKENYFDQLIEQSLKDLKTINRASFEIDEKRDEEIRELRK